MGLPGLKSVRLMRRNENIKKEDAFLIQSNRFLKKGLIGLSILSVLSIGSCWKNATALTKVRANNKELTNRVAYFQKDATKVSIENQKLKNYADDAQTFALGIRPWLDEHDYECEVLNCPKCKKIKQENDQKLDDFSKAIDTLNIDEEVLSRLQEGWQRQ